MSSYSQQQENQQQEEYILIREWGSGGVASGQFSQPADVAVDSKDNVFVTILLLLLKQFKNSIRMEFLSLPGDRLVMVRVLLSVLLM